MLWRRQMPRRPGPNSDTVAVFITEMGRAKSRVWGKICCCPWQIVFQEQHDWNFLFCMFFPDPWHLPFNKWCLIPLCLHLGKAPSVLEGIEDRMPPWRSGVTAKVRLQRFWLGTHGDTLPPAGTWEAWGCHAVRKPVRKGRGQILWLTTPMKTEVPADWQMGEKVAASDDFSPWLLDPSCCLFLEEAVELMST